ncbi:MAG: hypothetical protein E7317_12130 [Clostridiales bacterium]|nr:hypothetical protein [Clostridiales bacterium]
MKRILLLCAAALLLTTYGGAEGGRITAAPVTDLAEILYRGYGTLWTLDDAVSDAAALQGDMDIVDYFPLKLSGLDDEQGAITASFEPDAAIFADSRVVAVLCVLDGTFRWSSVPAKLQGDVVEATFDADAIAAMRAAQASVMFLLAGDAPQTGLEDITSDQEAHAPVFDEALANRALLLLRRQGTPFIFQSGVLRSAIDSGCISESILNSWEHSIDGVSAVSVERDAPTADITLSVSPDPDGDAYRYAAALCLEGDTMTLVDIAGAPGKLTVPSDVSTRAASGACDIVVATFACPHENRTSPTAFPIPAPASAGIATIYPSLAPISRMGATADALIGSDIETSSRDAAASRYEACLEFCLGLSGIDAAEDINLGMPLGDMFEQNDSFTGAIVTFEGDRPHWTPVKVGRTAEGLLETVIPSEVVDVIRQGWGAACYVLFREK